MQHDTDRNGFIQVCRCIYLTRLDWSMVILILSTLCQKDSMTLKHDIEDFVWSNHKAWIPRPLLSMHVRMGDKACEMKVVEFEEYMALATRIRKRFPNLDNIWLSTEMQVSSTPQ